MVPRTRKAPRVRQARRRSASLAVGAGLILIAGAVPAAADPGNGNAYGQGNGAPTTTPTTATSKPTPPGHAKPGQGPATPPTQSAGGPPTAATPSAGSTSNAGLVPPGNNGTVKVHALTTPVPDPRTVPHPGCAFEITGFNFDPNQTLNAIVVGHGGPNAGPGSYTSGAFAADGSGSFVLGPLALPAGMYKLTLDTGMGAGKHKVFKLECSTEVESETVVTEIDDTETPTGGETVSNTEVQGTRVDRLAAGGGGRRSAPTESGSLAFTGLSMVFAAIGLALILGGLAMLRSRPRRPHQLDVG